MNRFTKSLFFSVIAHIVVIGLVGVFLWTRKAEDDLMEVDLSSVHFSDAGSNGSREGRGLRQPSGMSVVARGNDGNRAEVSPAERSVERPVPQLQLRQTGVSGFVLSETDGAGGRRGMASGSDDGTGIGNSHGTGTGVDLGNGNGHGSGFGSDVDQYITTNYNYILTYIQRQVVYPSQARMMGISGKAVYSFVIRQDGHIDDLSLVSSAGFDALDAAGMKAIRKASPFPAPPAPARIKVPIVFSLQ